MLAAAYRLRRSDVIGTVVRTGMHITTPYIRIHALPTLENQHSRIACVVGKKVHSSAVKRHQYQRWLRQWAAELLPQLSHTYDIVLVAQPAITDLASLSDLTNTLSDIPKQLDKRSQ